MELFMLGITDTVIDAIDQTLGGSKKNEAMQTQDLNLLAYAPDQLPVLKRSFRTALIGCTSERIFDNINTAVIHYEQHHSNNNTCRYSRQKPHCSHHNKDHPDQHIVNAR